MATLKASRVRSSVGKSNLIRQIPRATLALALGDPDLGVGFALGGEAGIPAPAADRGVPVAGHRSARGSHPRVRTMDRETRRGRKIRDEGARAMCASAVLSSSLLRR